MQGGEIIVRGHVKNETGHVMRRGLIVVAGDSGDFTGVNMLAGAITATPQSAPIHRHLNLQFPPQPLCMRPMQAQTATFDTHAFVKRLTRAGMPEDQAEVLANGQSNLYERLVTKEYFEFTLNHELEKLRAELKHDIEKVRAELKLDIEKLRADLEHKFNRKEAAIREMEQKLTIRFGTCLGISVTVLALIIKFV